jgi:hypothetical protein
MTAQRSNQHRLLLRRNENEDGKAGQHAAQWQEVTSDRNFLA